MAQKDVVDVLGKVVVVLITAMSVVFGTFALNLYVTHQDWRGMVDNAKEEPGKPLGLRSQFTTLEEENKKLSTELDVLNVDIANARKARLDRLTELEAHRAVLQKKLDDFAKKRSDLNEVASEQGKKMKTVQDTINEKRDELKKVREETEAAKTARIEAFNKAAKVTVEVNQTQVEMDRLKARAIPLADQLKKLKEVVSSAP
jgi:chromosome segregation ATPase